MINHVLAILSLSLAATSAVAENCSAYIVSDQHSLSRSYSDYRRFHEVTCTEDIGSRQAASSAGIKAGIPIPVAENILSLSLDGQSSSSNFEQWKKTYCHISDSDTRISSLIQENSKTLSSASADVAKTCLNSEPVYGYFDVSASGQSFNFSFRVQGQETLLNSSVASDGKINCPNPSNNPFGLGNNRNISGQRHVMACSWDGRSDVRVLVNLKNQGSRTFTLSAPIKIDPYVPPAPVTVAPRNCQSADTVVAEMYRKILGREVDPAGTSWANNLRVGGKVKDLVGALLQSEEYKNNFIRMHNTNRGQMTVMLTTVFPGKVDEPLIARYSALMGGANFDQVVYHLVNSEEYARLVGHSMVPGSNVEYCNN